MPLYLIEILHQTTTEVSRSIAAAELYLIEILHQTTTTVCITRFDQPLYLIEILHQTTTVDGRVIDTIGCILSKFYIKPQQEPLTYQLIAVVSYRNSTSNHNEPRCTRREAEVVSYRNSTSNHNRALCIRHRVELYLIEILHQTTTHPLPRAHRRVVSYRNSTSNHNGAVVRIFDDRVVSYRNSTSNHNNALRVSTSSSLYLIEILHQTTTKRKRYAANPELYLIEILHQTTTPALGVDRRGCCVLSKFYIKPQPLRYYAPPYEVVSYRNSTSNHNPCTPLGCLG